MSNCPHNTLSKIIDRLGMMTEGADGVVSAPVLEARYVCVACGATVVHTANTAELARYEQQDLLAGKLVYAFQAIADAVKAVRKPKPPALPQGDDDGMG